jgi:hypothetical protein
LLGVDQGLALQQPQAVQFTQVQVPPLQHPQFSTQAQAQALQQLVPQHEMLLVAGAGVVMFATASMRPKMIEDIVFSFCSVQVGETCASKGQDSLGTEKRGSAAKDPLRGRMALGFWNSLKSFRLDQKGIY